MAEFDAFDDDAEVNGHTVLSVLEGVPAGFEDRATAILADHGIENPQPGDWYPQQAWLDAFQEIDAQVGEATLTRIGERIPGTAQWPTSIDLVVTALDLIDDAYHMNHRNGEIGSYDAEKIDNTTVHVTCRNPYPCSFDQGIIRAVAERVSLRDNVLVTEISDTCRSDGGDECIYKVEV